MKLIGLLLLFFIGFFAWRFVVQGKPLVLVSAAPARPAKGFLKAVDPSRGLVLEIENGDEGINLAELSVARSVSDQLGLSPPAGFVVEPLTVSERNKDNPDEVAYVAKFNSENLRWVGKLRLSATNPTELLIPANHAALTEGSIDLTFKAPFGPFGGASLSFSNVNLRQLGDKAKDSAGIRSAPITDSKT